ncbi:MAG: hypothetical protein K2X77_32640 [Candidatus Obscuribacterales bacterium]|nr:hypothetical protein [Candidatus Obscuribacterales bacterium]
MGLALVITALLSLLIGLTLGNASANMTPPGSTSLQLSGTCAPAIVGFIVGVIAAFNGVPVLAALVFPTILGLAVGGASVWFARWRRGR